VPVLWRYNNEVGDLNLQEVDESVKARTKGESITSLGPVNMAAAKTLCMPFEQDALPMVSKFRQTQNRTLQNSWRCI
jgi:hypothetical protein